MSQFQLSPGPAVSEPASSVLPSCVLAVLQRLDLSTPIKNPRRDFSNGFLAAEMMARFHVSALSLTSSILCARSWPCGMLSQFYILIGSLCHQMQPADVQMHSYENGTSERVKRDNWDQVCR